MISRKWSDELLYLPHDNVGHPILGCLYHVSIKDFTVILNKSIFFVEDGEQEE